MDFLDRYRVVRRLVLIWCCGLITYGTHLHFTSTEGKADSYSYIALVGILSTVIGFYVKKRHDEDAK